MNVKRCDPKTSKVKCASDREIDEKIKFVSVGLAFKFEKIDLQKRDEKPVFKVFEGVV